MRSITDKAEVSIDFPDKFYMGSFGRESSFEVKVEQEEVLLHIVRAGAERRQVAVHLHYFLLADILTDLGLGLAKHEALDVSHRDALRASIDTLCRALKKAKPGSRRKAQPNSK